MFCTNCGKEIADDSKFCIYCGAPTVQVNKTASPDTDAADGSASGTDNTFDDRDSSAKASDVNMPGADASNTNTSYSNTSYNGQNIYQQNGSAQPSADPSRYGDQGVQKQSDGFAIASLVLGILGFFLPIAGGILGIVFGTISSNRNGKNTMATVGKILGIISLVLWVVFIVLIIAGVAAAVSISDLGYYY